MRKFGQLPKSDGYTECNNGVVPGRSHALALIASSTRGRIYPFLRIYRRHYLHVRVSCSRFVSSSFARTRARTTFVSRARIARPNASAVFAGSFVINAYGCGNAWLPVARARKKLLELSKGLSAPSVCRAENDATFDMVNGKTDRGQR